MRQLAGRKSTAPVCWWGSEPPGFPRAEHRAGRGGEPRSGVKPPLAVQAKGEGGEARRAALRWCRRTRPGVFIPAV